MLPKNQSLKLRARELRNNMTEEEKILWERIRKKRLKDIQFYRQFVIGNYNVDFYSHQASLVIELDGSGHFTKDTMEYDEVRDNYIRACGLKILRFRNSEVRDNIEGVIKVIYENM